MIKEWVKLCIEKENECERLRGELERMNACQAVSNTVTSGLAPSDDQSGGQTVRHSEQGRRNEGGCFTCGETNHWERDCHQNRVGGWRSSEGPQKQGLRRDNQRSKTEVWKRAQAKWAVAPQPKGVTSSYLEVMIDGRATQCLLDSGSEISVFPSKFIPPGGMKETCRRFRAANGTEIPVRGEVEVPVEIAGFKRKYGLLFQTTYLNP